MEKGKGDGASKNKKEKTKPAKYFILLLFEYSSLSAYLGKKRTKRIENEKKREENTENGSGRLMKFGVKKMQKQKGTGYAEI